MSGGHGWVLATCCAEDPVRLSVLFAITWDAGFATLRIVLRACVWRIAACMWVRIAVQRMTLKKRKKPMNRVCWKGVVAQTSGYAQAAREYVLALKEAGIKTKVQTNEHITWESFDELYKEVSNIVTEDLYEFDNIIIHDLPFRFMDQDLAIGMTTWETDSAPDFVVESLNCLKEVWVPSEHSKKAFLKSVVTKPIFVIPHCFSPNDWQFKDRAKQKVFTFYTIGIWDKRKNVNGVIEAFCEEFSSSDDVRLVVKTLAKLDTQEWLAKELSRHTNPPKVNITNEIWPFDKIKKLHSLCDCYVTADRGESFGLGAFEAKLTGNRVIATGWGGTLDFLGESDILVPYELIPVEGMDQLYFDENQLFANINKDSLKQAMRRAYEEKLPRDSMSIKKLSKFTRESVGSLMKSRLTQLTENK